MADGPIKAVVKSQKLREDLGPNLRVRSPQCYSNTEMAATVSYGVREAPQIVLGEGIFGFLIPYQPMLDPIYLDLHPHFSRHRTKETWVGFLAWEGHGIRQQSLPPSLLHFQAQPTLWSALPQPGQTPPKKFPVMWQGNSPPGAGGLHLSAGECLMAPFATPKVNGKLGAPMVSPLESGCPQVGIIVAPRILLASGWGPFIH